MTEKPKKLKIDWAEDLCGKYPQESANEVRKKLADLLNEAAYGGQVTIITRANRPVAAIVPIALLRRLDEAVNKK